MYCYGVLAVVLQVITVENIGGVQANHGSMRPAKARFKACLLTAQHMQALLCRIDASCIHMAPEIAKGSLHQQASGSSCL